MSRPGCLRILGVEPPLVAVMLRAKFCGLAILSGILLISGFGTPLAASESPAALAIVNNSGFCLDGVWDRTRWPGGLRPDGLSIWGSFCGRGNDNVGRAESQDFLAPATLNLYLAGYPGLPGRHLILKNTQTGEERELIPPSEPAETWQYNSLPVPTDWLGKKVRLVAVDQATGPNGWFSFTLPFLPGWSLSLQAIDTTGAQGGFCREGVYSGTKWPETGRPDGTDTWGSYCKSGDAGTGWVASQPVNAGSELSIYLAGYPDTPGLSLAVENLQSGRQVLLHVPTAPREWWRLDTFALPPEWNGQLIRVIARDDSTGRAGWLAFSEPSPTTLGDKVSSTAKIFGRIILLVAALLFPSFAVAMRVKPWSARKLLYVITAALMTLGCTFVIYFSRFRSPTNGIIVGSAGLLAICAVATYCILSSKPRWLAALILHVTPRFEPSEKPKPFNLPPGRRRLVLILAWGLSAIAILPAVFHWTAPSPSIGAARYFGIGLGYLAALAICCGIFRVELRRLSWSQAVILVFLIFLLTGITNNVHSFDVDNVANLRSDPNRVWQTNMQEWVIQLGPWAIPHSYRFLPNSIVRWMQLAHLDFSSARDLYRLIVGLLLFYSIYKYARLYCNYGGAIIAMLLTAVIYPISFEYYAGQLTDPLSHLSFVLAFIFLETEEFALLFTTLIIGSLAKETVLAMAAYYVLFGRNEKHYPVKAAALCLASGATYIGVRVFVLHGFMNYKQVSGVTLENVWDNWQNPDWPATFLLTACALLPFLALGWKETALSLKRQVAFLFPVLFISSLFFSGLREARNFMPLVFVLTVIAGGYLSRRSMDALRREPALEIATQDKAAIVSGD